ncbi:MAG: mechanosensitive ion channel family protein [Telluria sp.]
MPLSNLLSDLIADLRDQSVLWQAGIIVLAALLGWSLARLLRNAWLRRAGGEAALHIGRTAIGADSFARVLGPLIALGLITGARYALTHRMHVNVLRVAVALAASLVVIRVGFYLLRRVFGRRGPVGAAIVSFERVFALLVWLGVALYITGLWPDILGALDDMIIPLGQHKISVLTILQACASVVVLLMLALWAGAALEERLMKVEGVNSSLRMVMARMSRALLIVVAVLASLSAVGIDITVLSVFGGALGVGLGLGLQKIASNYVSGFIILFERSLKIGDTIAVDKYNGRVTQINTRYTVLQGQDGTESVLPNEMLVSGAVQNFSLSSPNIRVGIPLTVAYGTDVQALLPQLAAAVAGAPNVLAEPAPGAALVKLGADGFELDVGVWVADPNVKGGVVSEANLRIWKLLQDQGVKLPYATRDIRLVSPDLAAIIGENRAREH